jgi:molecular chaperone HtpG
MRGSAAALGCQNDRIQEGDPHMTATADAPASPAPETHDFQADVKQLLHLVVHSLYSHKEIFLRELISNASDAIDKVKFRALTEHDILGEDKDFRIRVRGERKASTITIEDNGVGMTREELAKNLGTIAHSGTKAFLEKAKAAGSGASVNLIGEFGVGFYSSFLVADRVDVVSRAAGSSEAWRWSSDAQGSFTLEPASREGRGTTLTLHVREDQKEFLDEWRLRELIGRYSDYVSHAIQLGVEKEEESKLDLPGESKEAKKARAKTLVWETVNKASALWQRPKSEITDAQYEEFYKHLTHDWEAPLARTHFTFEGTQLFTGLLFVPKKPPFDLFDRNKRRGVRLYVKRVFIMDDCEELVPEWLRFLRGVIDSDDLPLNVSRELLQKESATQTIKKTIVKKTLELLDDLATSRQADYADFWKAYGVVLKEGLWFDFENKEKIAKLCRFETTRDEGLVALKDYVARMPAGQEAIYYVIADSKKAAAGSPHIEALRKKGFEVLLLTDPVDEWAVDGLREFEGKKLVSAMKANLTLDATDDEKKAREERAGALKPLIGRFQEVLKDHVKEVRVSDRLTDSPCCLVVPEGGLHAHMERLLRAHDRMAEPQKRILELNPSHPLVESLDALMKKEATNPRIQEWIEVLYDQALVAEGSPVDDPARFARRIAALVTESAGRIVAG